MCVFLDNVIAPVTVEQVGRPASQLAEVGALCKACENAPMDLDLIILTDALGALQNLTGLQRADFARSLRFHLQGEHLARLVRAVN